MTLTFDITNLSGTQIRWASYLTKIKLVEFFCGKKKDQIDHFIMIFNFLNIDRNNMVIYMVLYMV